MANKQYKTLKEFYPYYLTEHQQPVTQVLHFIGTLCGVIFGLGRSIQTGNWWYALIGLAIAYAFAWTSHFFFEKNKPATFQYPFYSFVSDFIMAFHLITFQLPKKMKQAKETIKK